MEIELKKAVKIKSGVFAKSDTNPDLYYIQSVDFDKQKKWNSELNFMLTNGSRFENHILHVGDVLFASKGRDFFAVVYDGKYQPAVASTTFLVLQVDKNILTPAFLAWFLNHPKTQKLLWSLAKGSSIPSISKSILENIKIPIPDIQKQNLILELFKLQQKEKLIHKQIGKLRQEYINELIYKSIQ
jgi:restriction endonuclease S subunit